MTSTTFDIVTAPACCRAAFLEGRVWGRVETWPEAYAAGYKACDEEISTLQRSAATIIHRLADAPIRDHTEDARQAERRAAYWREKRGEG